MNDVKRGLGVYYDRESFQAFEALSPRPAFDVPPDLDRVLIQNSYEVWEMIQHPKTFVYRAGLTYAAQKFEKATAVAAGSLETWQDTCDQLEAEGRISELLYD